MSKAARVLAAVAFLLVAAPAVSSAATAQALRNGHLALGVQDDALLTSSEPNAWPLAQSVHARVVRYNVAWNQVAPRRPQDPANPSDPAYDWSRVDLIASRTAAMGAAPMFTIVGAPSWASGHAAPSWGPRRAADLGSFCAALGRRYSGGYSPFGTGMPLPRVDLYTVWNEVNRGQYFQPQGARGQTAPVREAALMRACAPSLHRQNPHARVALGPLASRGAQGGLPPLRFLAAYRHAGGPRPDVIALNPYLEGLAPVYAPNEHQPDGAITIRNLGQLEQAGRRLYGRSLPVWLTEFAWRVGINPRMGAVDSARQAALTRRSLDLVRRHYPFAQVFVWFLLRDESPRGYWRTGLVSYDWRHNPVYQVWAGDALHG
jgi:hypothetical protein